MTNDSRRGDTNRSAPRTNRRGFTLIELAVTTLVLATLAGIAFTRSSQTLQKARVNAFLLQLENFDQHTRRLARQHGEPWELVIDPVVGTIERNSVRDSRRHASLRMPKAVRNLAIHIVGRWQSRGRITIPIAPTGHAPDYVVKFSAGGRTTAGLVVGTTGQFTFELAEAELDAILRRHESNR